MMMRKKDVVDVVISVFHSNRFTTDDAISTLNPRSATSRPEMCQILKRDKRIVCVGRKKAYSTWHNWNWINVWSVVSDEIGVALEVR